MEELLIEVDEQDNPIGLRPKSDFQHGKRIHRSAHLILKNANWEILLQKRSPEKKLYPNLYTFSASGAVADESYEECIIRETREEIGICIHPEFVCTYFSGDDHDRAWRTMYSATSDAPVYPDEREISEIKWIWQEQLEWDMKQNPGKYTPPFLAGMKRYFLSTESLSTITQRLQESPSQEVCLREAYEILTVKYHWERLKTYSRFWELLSRSPEQLWKKTGFLHCTNLNILLKALLVGSGHFRSEDIRFRWTQIWIVSPHQYAQVRIGNQWINIDIWAHHSGINFGDHAHGFH